MRAIHCFLIVTALLLDTLEIGDTLFHLEKPVDSKNPLRDQLTSYEDIYNALISGIRVRYYTNFTKCSMITGDLVNNQGGEIEYFEATHVATYSSFNFSSEMITVDPIIATVWSEFQVTSDGVVFAKVSQLNPSTLAVLNASMSKCDVNDGQTGAAYFYSAQSSPPNLLTSFKEVNLTLNAGFAVTYTVDYEACVPQPQVNSDSGGVISRYEDIIVNNASVGLQFAGRFVVTSTPSVFNERLFSLYQNGTVIVEQMTIAPDFHPLSSSTLLCQMNAGKNDGSVNFFARNSGPSQSQSSNL